MSTRTAAGPVTFFRIPLLQAPTDGLKTVNGANVTFEFAPVEGADLYQVQVYDNILLQDPYIYKSPILSATGETVIRHKATGFVFPSGKTLYWVVGARRSGEALPYSGNVQGFIRSAIFSFSTPSTPPDPVGSSAPVRGGTNWWGQVERQR
jgi:hypothetical protein